MGITDCDHVCSRCGEHMSSCYLCRDEPSAVVRIGSDRQRHDDDAEIAAQTRAIRRAADRRQGWL
jgi:hypothetical protein